ncbi:MAG: hypothetical protein DMG99_07450 [Acidobacteria bacterium]|nr:MAG: hypothetical protein DMG99_07450 [Acidobacteriota bacterium]
MSAVRRCLPGLVSLSVVIFFSGFTIIESSCGSSSHSSSTTTSGAGNGGTSATGTTGTGTGSGSSGSGSGSGGTSGGSSASAPQFLYVAGTDGVSAWQVNQDSSLTAVSGSPFGVGRVNVVADPVAAYLFSMGSVSQSDLAVNTDAIAADGSLKVASSFADTTLSSGMSINPSGTVLYVGSISAAQQNPGWKIFDIQSDGSVKFVSGVVNQTANRLIFTPDGSNAYDAYCYHLAASIEHWSVASDGTLTPVSGQVAQIESMNECPMQVAITPDGKMLAATWVNADQTGQPDNRIMLYTIDPTTHALTAVSGGPFNASGAGNDATFDASGKFLVVAQDNGVGVYQVSQNAVVEVPGSPFASGTNFNRVAFSPSGGSVAAISNASGRLYVFSFNSSSGALGSGPGSPMTISGPNDLSFTKQ